MKTTIHPKIQEVLMRFGPDPEGEHPYLAYGEMDIPDKEKIRLARKYLKNVLVQAKENLIWAEGLLSLCK